MTMDFSTLKSKNGERYDDFVKKAKEKKKFEFTLDGNFYKSDEYEIDNANHADYFITDMLLINHKHIKI